MRGFLTASMLLALVTTASACEIEVSAHGQAEDDDTELHPPPAANLTGATVGSGEYGGWCFVVQTQAPPNLSAFEYHVTGRHGEYAFWGFAGPSGVRDVSLTPDGIRACGFLDWQECAHISAIVTDAEGHLQDTMSVDCGDGLAANWTTCGTGGPPWRLVVVLGGIAFILISGAMFLISRKTG